MVTQFYDSESDPLGEGQRRAPLPRQFATIPIPELYIGVEQRVQSPFPSLSKTGKKHICMAERFDGCAPSDQPDQRSKEKLNQAFIC